MTTAAAKPSRNSVAILGAGNMGTALAQVIASNGHLVRLWSIETDVLEEIRDHRRNTKYLKGIDLDDSVQACWDLGEATKDAGLVILSVPSQVVASLARDLAAHLKPAQAVLNVAKGLEAQTRRRLSEVLVDALGSQFRATTGSMGGPAIAMEMARGQPMAVVIAIPDEAARMNVQDALQNENLKVATTDDVQGLELCAALKNVYAIALGMCDGLELGANTKAFLGTVAIGEMARICEALGGRRETAYGLAGLGDLLTTGWSQHSRNRTLGEKMGAGADWQAFLVDTTVEGAVACAVLKEVIAPYAMRLPMFDSIEAALSGKQSAPQVLGAFLREFSYA